MKLSQLKDHLSKKEQIAFMLPNGTLVPSHFHVTEIGHSIKNFIDCGGTIRQEERASLQLWEADDYDHRLHPEKLNEIIELSERILEIPDLEIEVEYQGDTINKYDLDFDGAHFLLTNTKTDCLAKDKCGITPQKPKVKLTEIQNQSCAPGSGCC